MPPFCRQILNVGSNEENRMMMRITVPFLLAAKEEDICSEQAYSTSRRSAPRRGLPHEPHETKSFPGHVYRNCVCVRLRSRWGTTNTTDTTTNTTSTTMMVHRIQCVKKTKIKQGAGWCFPFLYLDPSQNSWTVPWISL